MKESDWKKFKVIKEKARDLFCTRVLEEFGEVISNTGEHVHSRYLELYQRVHERNEEMALVFDGHSRSKAAMQLLDIRARGLADDLLVEELSDEFRHETNPNRFGQPVN